MPRTNLGRQKIEMKKMSKESNLLVTFSKRRSGIFKKASELCTLSGAQIAIIVFSPGKKVFSFGHPSVEALIDRFQSMKTITENNPNPNPNPNSNPNPNPNPGVVELFQAHRDLNLRGLNLQLSNLLNQLELVKKRGGELSKLSHESAERCWWERPTESLNAHQLKQVNLALEELRKNVISQSEKMQLETQGENRAPYFMGVGPGGGHRIGIFPPQVSQREQIFPSFVPPQDLNASELGLYLTSHGYSMGYNRGGYFG